jgi:hypothetical protein
VPDSDVQRLRAVLELAAEHRLMLGAIKVGDISIQVVARVPIDAPRPSGPNDGHIVPIDDKLLEREKWLVEARKRCKETFGSVKSDDVLWEMRGAI